MNDNHQYPPHQRGGESGTSTKAIVSMVLGIVFIPLCCMCFIALPASIVGLILGILSRTNNEGSKGCAIAGITLCSIAMALSAFCLITDLILFSQTGTFFPSWNDLFGDILNGL